MFDECCLLDNGPKDSLSTQEHESTLFPKPSTPEQKALDESSYIYSTPKKQVKSTLHLTPLSQKLKEIHDSRTEILGEKNTDITIFSCTTILANHLFLYAPKNNINSQYKDDNHFETISHPLDYLRRAQIMNRSDSEIGPIKTKLSYKCNTHSQKYIIGSHNYTSTTCTKIFSSGVKTDVIPALGSYKDIAKEITKITKAAHITDSQFAGFLREFGANNESLEATFSKNQISFICNLSSLLFCLEPKRNATAAITNQMMLDLIIDGKFSFKDLPNKMPMAIQGAVRASRTVASKLFTPIKQYQSYDQHSRDSHLSDENAKSLIDLSNEIITLWLKNRGIDINSDESLNNETLRMISDKIIDAMKDWYLCPDLPHLPIIDRSEYMMTPPSRSCKLFPQEDYSHTNDDYDLGVTPLPPCLDSLTEY